jgi:hypothetical protein
MTPHFAQHGFDQIAPHDRSAAIFAAALRDQRAIQDKKQAGVATRFDS